VKLRPSRGSSREPVALDLTADDESTVGLEEASMFYPEHRAEFVARMRNPTSLTSNPAAIIVARCETNARLQAEALEAIEDARLARVARDVLDLTMDRYAPKRAT
jgi:hypothetical protein